MGELINVFSKIVRVLNLGYKTRHAWGGLIAIFKFKFFKFKQHREDWKRCPNYYAPSRIMHEELLSVLNLKYQCCPGQLSRICGMRSLSLFGSSLSVSNFLEKCFSFCLSNKPSIFCRVSCLYCRSHTVSAKYSWLVNFIEWWIGYTLVTR